MSGITRVSQYQNQSGFYWSKRQWMAQETVNGSGISWAICKSAPHPRQITLPAPHHSVFTSRMTFLPPTNSVKALKAYMPSKRWDYYAGLELFWFWPHLNLVTAKPLQESNPGIIRQNPSTNLLTNDPPIPLMLILLHHSLNDRRSQIIKRKQFTLIFPSCPPDASISESREKQRQRTASSIIM